MNCFSLKKQPMILNSVNENQVYTIEANHNFNGLVLAYDDKNIWIDEVQQVHTDIYNTCQVGDLLVSINDINVDYKNIEKILQKLKKKKKKMMFIVSL